MPSQLICLVVGYACGCFLTAEVVCQRVVGRSAFSVGIGNPGMANVAAELGIRWGLVVLAGDIAKTALAVLLSMLLIWPEGTGVAGLWAGLGATLGHNFPVWHRFRGGKGVATTCSAIILAVPVAGVASVLLGAATVLVTKRLCVGALVIPAAFLVFLLVSGPTGGIVPALVLLGLMAIAHGPAIAGIRTGATPKTDVLAKVRGLRRG